ncbi:hypothetical protein GCM10009112_27590 [Marinomonas arenicola]|uniref:hypothetical protein n=1 Tax=Marinomonas TaxID=28253 RepID=UPI0010561DE4|nr:hypothetical protein [Marinomonas sp. KMM3893]
MDFRKTLPLTLALLGAVGSSASIGKALDLKFAGALEFSDQGTLFVGDNINGAIYAFEINNKTAVNDVHPIKIDDIDVRIANLLGVGKNAIEINDMAVHPVTHDVYISVSRIGNQIAKPAIIKVAQDDSIQLVDLNKLKFSEQKLANYPDQTTNFQVRGLMGMPPTAKDIAKGDVKLSSLAIMDILYHDHQLYVSGVAYDNFLSTLRKMPYPFTGTQNTTSVEMYHIAHDQYETRAPIRSMSIQKVDGVDQMVAAYTCSPIVLIPLTDIKDGAKIAAHTIGDMGNGQPIDMIPYTFKGKKMLFVTNNSRSPQVIPVDGLNNARTVTDKDFARGPKMDLGPVLPYGPVGEMVMFEGVSMHMDLLSDKYFVSITRDTQTGGLNLDSNPTFFPNRVHNLVAEYDFPQYQQEHKKQAE